MHRYSFWQFVLTAFAVAGLWLVALIFAILGLKELAASAPTEGLPYLMMSASLGATGLLLCPSIYLAVRRLMGAPAKAIAPLHHLGYPMLGILLAIPVVILAGNWVAQMPWLAWLALPGLHVLAIGLPVLWVLLAGLNGLSPGSAQRTWGVFGSGLVLGPAIILTIELAMVVAALLVVAGFVASQPQLRQEILALLQQPRATQVSLEELLRVFEPYLLQPWVIFGAILIAAVLVPLTEEAFKPIGVWLLVGQNLRPAAGFACGLLSGAGYALFESLISANGGEQWGVLALARAGTAVVHIFTTGMVGWALSQSWRDRHYARLGLVYLCMVIFHGLWNGLTVISVFASLGTAFPSLESPAWMERLGVVTPLALGMMTLLAFTALLAANRSLRKPAAQALMVEAAPAGVKAA
jgi:uncharacterized membrane protein